MVPYEIGFVNSGHGAVADGATSRRRVRCQIGLLSHWFWNNSLFWTLTNASDFQNKSPDWTF
jgi:hypothetical protein